MSVTRLPFLVLLVGACGDPPDFINSAPLTWSANIQRDAVSLSCAAVSCHDKNSTTKLKLDPTPGQEMTNYQGLLTNGLVIKGDANNSPFITVPRTGMSGSPPLSHVQTLTGRPLRDWQSWVSNGAPF